jgi:NADH dehydrogenase FAD-containing subunit
MINNIIYALGTVVPQRISDYINLSNNKEKELVYVVGNGWASYYFVKNLDKSKFKPVIIAPNKDILNTPKLVNRVMDPDANVEFPNPYAEKIHDLVEDINTSNSTLITKSGAIYPYKRVVFAIGSEPNDFGIPGVDAHTLKLKTIADADLLRNKISNLSLNSTIYIVGSGVTGIELGSKINNNIFGIKIIEGMDEILPGFNDKTKSVIFDYLTRIDGQLEIKLSNMVKSINQNQITISLGDKSTINENYRKVQDLIIWTDGVRFNGFGRTKSTINENYSRITDLIIWTGGVRFNGFGRTKLFESLNKITPIKPRGLDVGLDFSLKTNNMIYCLGDMVGNAGPPTAQNAKNQGIWLAGYFNSGFDNDYIKSNPYKVKSNGKMVHLKDKVYLESEYYSGFVSNLVAKIGELFY